MLAERMSELKPSATVAIQETLSRLAAEGVDVVRLNAGEPDTGTPARIVAAGQRALLEGKTRYTSAAGILPLRQALADKLSRDNELHYTPQEIVVTVGAKQALSHALMALLNPGDEVIIPAPAWVSYGDMVRIAGGRPVFVPTDENYLPEVETIRAALTRRSRLLILNSPNNPTGAVYPEARLSELAALALEHDLWVISDEIYEKLVYNGARHRSIGAVCPELKPRLVIINGFSKSYAMTGWRIGYLAAPLELGQAVITLASHITSNVTTFVQWAALTALAECEEEIQDLRQRFGKRRLLLAEGLNRLPGIVCPLAEGAFYLMPNVSAWFGRAIAGRPIRDSLDFTERLLAEAHVAVIPGEAFEAPGTVRVSYAASEEALREGLQRMENWLGQS